MDFSFLTGCAGQFWQITSGVCRTVAACVGSLGRPARLPQPMLMEVHRRVSQAQARFLALMERVRTGRQRGGWSRTAPVLATGGLPGVSRAGIVLPRRFGWLVGLVGYEVAGRASQLAHLLADPEMAALVRDVPQARRILAPLCRMMGVDCAGLRGVRRVRVRAVVAAPVVAAVVAVVPERVGYVPSARWPRGVVSRRGNSFKPD